MPVHNAEIADIFERLADLLELEDANPFRVRAYRNAARTIRGYPETMSRLVEKKADLAELPNIGEDLARKIATIVRTGKLLLLREIESRTPGQLSDLMKIQGLGPKRVKTLHKELDIRSVDRRVVDAHEHLAVPRTGRGHLGQLDRRRREYLAGLPLTLEAGEIGRASCRERV